MKKAAKELECLFEAIDDGDQILAEDGNNAAEPTVTHHHHEAVNDTAPAAAQFLQHTELPEIDFRKLSGCAFAAPHGTGGLAKTAVLADKPVQRGIWHSQPLASEQLVDFRQNQFVFLQPQLNLWLPRQQCLFNRPLLACCPRSSHALSNLLELCFIGHALPGFSPTSCPKRINRRTVFRSEPVDRAIARIRSLANHRRIT